MCSALFLAFALKWTENAIFDSAGPKICFNLHWNALIKADLVKLKEPLKLKNFSKSKFRRLMSLFAQPPDMGISKYRNKKVAKPMALIAEMMAIGPL